jgi:HEAT repeat protein
MRTLALILLATSLAAGQGRPPDPGTEARQLLDQATRDRNPDHRKEAVVAFSLLDENDVLLASLGSLLHDKDVVVRLAVVSVLGDLKIHDSIPLLEQALDDSVPEVRFAAAKVLYHLHNPQGKQVLMAVYDKRAKGSSNYLVDKERATLRLLHTPSRLFMTIAQNAADMVVPVPGLGLGVSSVQGILTDPELSPRATVLLLTVHENDGAVHEAVRAGLTDKEWSVRAAAVHVVAIHPYPDLQSNLVALMDDRRAAVRYRAANLRTALPARAKP